MNNFFKQEDRELLKKWGNTDEEINYIFANYKEGKYSLESLNDPRVYIRISPYQASLILGKELFLSGLSRAIYHWGCGRNYDRTLFVHFDFREFNKRILGKKD